MDTEELKKLAVRFEKGETTANEDLKIVTALNGSLEMAKFFLNEIKVAKIQQELNK